MRIGWKQMKNLPVQTKSGAVLGKVRDYILQTDGQNIVQYEVGSLFSKKYIISREQVLSIDENKIIVDDNILEVNIEDKVEMNVGSADVGVAMRE